MTNWPTKKLGEICEIRMGETLIKKDLTGNGVPVYSADSLEKPWGFTSKNKLIFTKGAIIVGARGTLGSVKLPNDEQFTSTQTTIIINPQQEIVSSPFLSYYLRIVDFKELRGGSGIPMLTVNRLSNLQILLPSPTVQQKIVKVLDAIQEAVRVQEKIIERTKELKKAIVNEIFNPKVKDQKPKLKFKIQKWVKLGSICQPRKEQCLPKISDKYVGLEHLDSGNPMIRRFGNGSEVRSLKNKFYPTDILYGKLRPYLDKVAIANFKGICSTDILVLSCDKERALPEYLINIFHTSEFLNFAISATSGTNHPRVSWESLKVFPVPLFSIKKQREIAEILQTIDQKIEIEKRKKALYEELFKTMLNKLMNGEIEVEKIDFRKQ